MPDELDGTKTIASAVLRTLSAGEPAPFDARDDAIATTSQRWQQMGSKAKIAEAHGVINALPDGRVLEVIGHVAAVGEQLGLALTCSHDAHRWLAEDASAVGRPLGARALAEMTGYYILSASHALANITLRALLIGQPTRALVDAAFPGAKGFPPFSDDRDSWKSLSPAVVTKLSAVAQQVAVPSAVNLVTVLSTLAGDGRWKALDARRSVDFHRWRPQSITGGVTAKNPWTEHPDGTRSMSIRASSDYIPPEPGVLVVEADAALDALHDAMTTWLDQFPAATRDLGVPLFKTT
ncbi:hypothetical protein [Curtobacterium aurantiacum]|uniref:hypothetical protein n=1 Tax=Curtobacterium aurantiacum TaxID=3236919 RepID=UPI001BDFBC0A|nr:hypothetical protein [Curtobacterium flaccumfaciens]MBT1674654.1 hypothetical protein [Curtobacterium flaccumfaciens pv. flaccumfaciens]